MRKNKVVQKLVKDTVKLPYLDKNKNYPKLVASSIYASKSVHFLFILCSTLSCQLNNKVVFNMEINLRENNAVSLPKYYP